LTTLPTAPRPSRIVAAALTAGLGISVTAVLVSVPAGLAAGQPAVLAALVLSARVFWATFVVSSAAVALVLMSTVAWQRRSRGIDSAAALWLAEPLLWGCGLPTAALLIDPWLFYSATAVLAATGVGLGAIGTAARARLLPPSRPASRCRVLALVVTAAILVPSALVVAGPPWFHNISGDEPHYLAVARSIWVDGDLDVRNDYTEGLLSPFWPGELWPHAKPGADPEELYSIHGTGLAVWLAPWYGVGSDLTEDGFNVLVRIAMTLWLAAAAACLFLLLGDIAGPTAATRGTVVAIFTLPLVFAGPHLFPAVPAFALSCAAYLIVRRQARPIGFLAAGLLLACLPWLHYKFFGVMAAVGVAGVLALRRRPPGRDRSLALAFLVAPLLISGLGHAAFTWALYERLSPLAIAVGADPTLRAPQEGDNWIAYVADPVGVFRAGFGYFLDQREGLLFYAPQYLLAFSGFAWLLRRRRDDAIALGIVLLALVGPYALSQEIGHWSPPARPVTGVLWTLAVPMGVGLCLPAGSGRRGRGRSALRGALLGWGIGATVLLLLQTDLLYHDYNVPRSLVLQRYGAPGLPLAEFAPLWLGPDGARWGPALLWLAIVAIIATFLWSAIDDEATEAAGCGAEDTVAADRREMDTPTIRAPLGPGYKAAAWLFVAIGAFLLWHHARVPLSSLHAPWTFGTISYWKPESPPTRAWWSESGVWTGGFDSVELLLSSPEPIDALTFDLDALVPMQVTMQVGRDRQTVRVRPGERSYARFTPGPATFSDGEYFYHLNVVAAGGASRAALGLANDVRSLGIFLEVVQAETGG